jgi:hypothetical protein
MEKEDQKLLEVAICGYLPYGLKSENKFVASYGLTNPLIQDVFPSNMMKFLDGSTKSKILLRPIECLTKPITVEGYNDGKEFVPMVELFRERNKGWKNMEKPDRCEWQFEDYPAFFSVSHCASVTSFRFDRFNPSSNPYWVIDLLNQWHIDWRGLIAKGLAVDKTSAL